MMYEVYIIKNTNLDVYIGQTKKKIGINYFTSSKKIKLFWKKNINLYQVLYTGSYGTEKGAKKREEEIILCFKGFLTNRCLNEASKYKNYFKSKSEISQVKKDRFKNYSNMKKGMEESEKEILLDILKCLIRKDKDQLNLYAYKYKHRESA